MSDFVAWLVVIEAIGLAFLPLTLWSLRRLPDRGYIFAKIIGLLLVTYVTWIIGNLAPIVRSPIVPAVVLVASGGISWWRWHSLTLKALSEIRRIAVTEEALFVLALAIWSLLRAHIFGAGITHTEQPMDMMFLSSTLASGSYPPHDAWMSGHSINYYYFGYLTFAMLVKLSGAAPAVGYNLSLSYLFAITVTASYSIGYALSRRLGWALLAPILLALVGNWHAILWLLPHSGCAGSESPSFWPWMFDSTRVVGGHFTLADWGCSHSPVPSNTIDEFPLFSFVLGDLHPHVMALPLALLSIALGLAIIFRDDMLPLNRSASTLGFSALLSLAVGALFVTNSWDFPTYLLVVAACIGVNAYVHNPEPSWWKLPLLQVVICAGGGLLLYLPFYIHFRSPAGGLGWVYTRSDPFEFVQVFGLFLLACGSLLATLNYLLRPAEEVDVVEWDTGQSPAHGGEVGLRGQAGRTTMLAVVSTAALFCLAALAAYFHLWLAAALAGVVYLCMRILYRLVNTDRPNFSDAAAVIMIGIAMALVVVTETIYIRDVFDGGDSYRMNTVFKFYYQSWILLSLAGAYGIYRTWQVLRELLLANVARVFLVVVIAGVIGAGMYTRYVPAYAVDQISPVSLDGMAWLKAAQPSDYATIQWLRSHASDDAVELEATGGEYSPSSGRIATFTGLQTVMGWAGHENQWRPGDPEIGARANDVKTMYMSSNVDTARQLLRKYGVRYVIVGSQEQAAYGSSPGGLSKFAKFMKVAFQSGSTTVYTW